MKNKYDIFSLLLVLLLTLFRGWLVVMGAAFHWLFLLLCLLGISSLWSVKHNHLHLPVFVHKKWNQVFSKLLTLNTGTSCITTTIVHVAVHHRHNNNDADWTSVHHAQPFRWKFLELVTYPFALLPKLIKGKKAYLEKERNTVLKPKIRLDKILIWTMLILSFCWAAEATFWYIILPVIFGQWFLMATNYMQHRDCDHTSDLDHSINYTGRIYNALFFNVGYHTAHHCYPNAHWSELRRLHDATIAPKMNPALNKSRFWQSMLMDYLFKFQK